MAVVLRVSFEDDPPMVICQKGDIVILKLYNRRFAKDPRRNHRAAPYISALEADYLQDLIKKPPGSSGLPDPAEKFLIGRLRGDVGDDWKPSTQKPASWEHDLACPNYQGSKNENGAGYASDFEGELTEECGRENNENENEGAGYEPSDDGQQNELDEDELEEGETEDNEEEVEHEDEGEDDEVDLESEYDQELYGTPVENLRPLQWRYLYLASCKEKAHERLPPLQLEGRVPTFLSSVELVVESLSSASVQLLDDIIE